MQTFVEQTSLVHCKEDGRDEGAGKLSEWRENGASIFRIGKWNVFTSVTVENKWLQSRDYSSWLASVCEDSKRFYPSSCQRLRCRHENRANLISANSKFYVKLPRWKKFILLAGSQTSQNSIENVWKIFQAQQKCLFSLETFSSSLSVY